MHMGTQEACQQKLTGAPVFEYLYSTKWGKRSFILYHIYSDHCNFRRYTWIIAWCRLGRLQVEKLSIRYGYNLREICGKFESNFV